MFRCTCTCLAPHSASLIFITVGLWLRYMKFESSTVGGDLSNVGKVYWRAMKTLSPDLVSTFITKHTLWQSSL